MSHTPFDALLDRLEWKPVKSEDETATENQDGLPRATHTGVIQIGGLTLEVVQLDNGQRVITEESMVRFFESFQERESSPHLSHGDKDEEKSD